MNAIETRGLRRVFGDIVALDSLDLSIREGEIYGIVGPDGAGKTTLLRMLAGVLLPTAGSIQIDGLDAIADRTRATGHLGYMSQRFGLYPDLTVLENIRFYADLYGVRRAEYAERLPQLLGFSNLTPFQHRHAGRLSGGMKQKLGLACALIHTPRVLLLDEPTNGVDPISRRDFCRILYQLLSRGVTILVSTSYLDEAERCARLLLLDRGCTLAAGTPDEVRATMPGAILEVRTGTPRRVARVLRESLCEPGVGLFGDCIHVAAADPTAAESRIREAATGAGLTIESVQRIEPSLEDVFISAVARATDGAKEAGR
jgi:ABC-2 type transport system ATP-binding protein